MEICYIEAGVLEEDAGARREPVRTCGQIV